MKEINDHSFNINVAEYFHSVEKAILLKEFYGWIKINKDNNRNIHYGEAWTYNSAEALNAKFKYMHPKSIWRWVNELSIDGLICISRFNEKRYDKTNWYAINWAAYIAICEGKNELIEEYISHFKKFQKLVFDSQNEKSISQNKKRYSQNEKSISQNEEPIPSLTISSSSLTISEPFVEKEFSTVLIDEVDETKVEVHHIPDYFDTEEKKERKSVAAKKKESAPDPTPINQMWQAYEKAYASLNAGEVPVFHKKYLRSLKTLYVVLKERAAKKGIIPLNDIQPWQDFLDMVVAYLKNNPKQTYLRGRFDPLGLESEFNKFISELVNNRTAADKKAQEWADLAKSMLEWAKTKNT